MLLPLMCVFCIIHSCRAVAARGQDHSVYQLGADSDLSGDGESTIENKGTKSQLQGHKFRERSTVEDAKAVTNHRGNATGHVDIAASRNYAVILTLGIFVAVLGLGLGAVLLYLAWDRYKPAINGYVKLVRGTKSKHKTEYTALDMIPEDSSEDMDDKPRYEDHRQQGNETSIEQHSVGDGSSRPQRCWKDNASICSQNSDTSGDNKEAERNCCSLSHFQGKSGKSHGRKSKLKCGSKNEAVSRSSCDSVSADIRCNLARNKGNKVNRTIPANCFDEESRQFGEGEVIDSDYETNEMSTDSEAHKSRHTFRRRHHHPSLLTTLDIENRSCDNVADGNNRRIDNLEGHLALSDAGSSEHLVLPENIDSVSCFCQKTEKSLRFDVNIDKAQDVSDSREELMKQWRQSRRKSIRASIYCVSSDSDEDFVPASAETGEMQPDEEQVIYFNYIGEGPHEIQRNRSVDLQVEESDGRINRTVSDVDDRYQEDNGKWSHVGRLEYDSDDEIADTNRGDVTEREALMSDHLLQGLMLSIIGERSTAFDKHRLIRSHSDSELAMSSRSLSVFTNGNSFSTSNLRSKQIIPASSNHEEKNSQLSKSGKKGNSVGKKLRSVMRFLRINRKKRNKNKSSKSQ